MGNNPTTPVRAEAVCGMCAGSGYNTFDDPGCDHGDPRSCDCAARCSDCHGTGHRTVTLTERDALDLLFGRWKRLEDEVEECARTSGTSRAEYQARLESCNEAKSAYLAARAAALTPGDG